MSGTSPAWTDDARLARGMAHAQRGEVLQAEMLLRGLLQDHPGCTPALATLAAFAANRGDTDRAQELLTTALANAPEDAALRFSLAQVQAEGGKSGVAMQGLKALLRDSPDHGGAGLLLADLYEQGGDDLGALRARFQVITQAQSAGRWLSRDSTEPAWLKAVLQHVEKLRTTRRAYLMASFDALRQLHGSAAMRRVERALTGYLGEWDAAPPDPRQQPKFLYFPDLPPGPYHDPLLQPWAHQLQTGWQDMRAEALELLSQDRDFESFLGLKPGQRASDYVSGSNPNAAWDAFFFYRHGERFDANHVRCPQTSAVLASIDLCHVDHQAPEVCFSVIRPQTTLVRHYGVTNTRLVMHLPLVVPPNCALNVIDAGTHAWRAGELMMFDDTFQHEAWNHSDEPRLILLMDCWNPHLTLVEQRAVRLLVQAIHAVENEPVVA